MKLYRKGNVRDWILKKLVKSTLPLTICLHDTSDVQSRIFVVEPDENNFFFGLVTLKA